MLKDQIHFEDIPNNVALTFTMKTLQRITKKTDINQTGHILN